VDWSNPRLLVRTMTLIRNAIGLLALLAQILLPTAAFVRGADDHRVIAPGSFAAVARPKSPACSAAIRGAAEEYLGR
jgi:hypothetical protein